MIFVSGHSDDIIDISDTDQIFDTQFYPSEDETWIAFSDGTLLRVDYDGDWNVLVKNKGDNFVKKGSADNGYSDEVELTTSGMMWMVIGGIVERRPRKM